jgi:hypothetical protein
VVEKGHLYSETYTGISQINSAKYEMVEGIERNDTNFFENTNTTKYPPLRKQYIGVCVSGYYKSVELKEKGNTDYKKLEPIK